ncbi:MAG TPA: DoxX family protein [Povalibacter sp.]
MATAAESALPSARDRKLWIGWTLSGLIIAFMLMDATMKLLTLPVVLQAGDALGFAGAPLARGLGAGLLICTLLYAAPRTSVLGAIVLTGYLGGAVAAHVRVGNPLFSHVLFGVYLGVMLWGGLYLRDARLRALLPLMSSAR